MATACQPVFVPNVSVFARNLPRGLQLSASVFNVFNNEYRIRAPKNIDRTASYRRAERPGQSSHTVSVEPSRRRDARASTPSPRDSSRRRWAPGVRSPGVASARPGAQRRGENGPRQPEYLIKAAYLYNFALFVEWPDEAFADPDAPFVVGISDRIHSAGPSTRRSKASASIVVASSSNGCSRRRISGAVISCSSAARTTR